MHRVFRTKVFGLLQRRSGLTDADLCYAVAEMESRLFEADLGGGVIKKRVALPGRGKSGGARTIVATAWKGSWFFLYMFAKNARSNISDKELEGLQKLATDLLKMKPDELDRAVSHNILHEICHDQN